MSPAQFEELERALGLRLPQEYRAALLEYPLPRDPHSTELWLCDDPGELQGSIVAGARRAIPRI